MSEPWIGPEGQVMRRLELHLTYTCPEACVFCSEEHRMQDFRAFPVTWGRVATVLRAHAARGVRYVHFTGGEPSIHPRFAEVLELARKLGMQTSVGTIGTRLCKPEHARVLAPLLDQALFSLHGPDAATHDALARREGSFDRVTAAIRNSRAHNPRMMVAVNTVLTRANAARLPETVAFAASLGAQLVVVSNTTPEGAGLDAYEALAVPLAELRALVAPTVAAAGTAVLRFFGVPYCILGDHGALSNDLHWDPRVTVEWTRQPGKVVFDDIWSWDPGRKRVHTAACTDCAMKGLCRGVFDRYAELWPTPELAPPR